MLLTGIFFEPGADIPIYGIRELQERSRIHQNVNDVGTSNYNTFLADPQPAPLFQATGPRLFERIDVQKPYFENNNNITYRNYTDELMASLRNLNKEEFSFLFDKHKNKD